VRTIRVFIVLSLTAACVALAAPGIAAANARIWQPRALPGAASLAPRAGLTTGRTRVYVPGQLLVEFRSGVSGSELRSVARGAGAVVSRRLLPSAGSSGRMLVLVSSSMLTTPQLAARFRADASVAGVSPNYLRTVDSVPPDDPGLAGQWGLQDVRAGDAWQTTSGSGDVVIADIDTGVDFTHPDLAANMWHNPGEIAGNGIDDDGNGYVDDVYGINPAYDSTLPVDDYGHGTHTSGIAAAVGDNGLGVAGLGGHTRIMALKFIGYWGGGTDADAIECIDYAVREKLDHGVNVVAINASWGGLAPDPFLRAAINRAGAAGIVFCASAGNDSANNDLHPQYPSSFDCPNIISVAATDPRGRLAAFSNHGRVSVDIGAPGEDILSTVPDGAYQRWSGTSMAAPFVAGAVALCAASHPGETAAQRVERILDSARPVGALAKETATGGTLDAGAAVRLSGGAGDVTPPVTTAFSPGDGAFDVSVPVALFAADGADGSGVARTQWRVDGGAWHSGSSAVVPAPRATRRTRVLEYRSTDNVGNVEEPGRLGVAFDTTRAAAGRSGVALPASPVSGGLSMSSRGDLYKLRLRRGETFKATADGISAGSVAILVFTEQGHGPFVARWAPAEAPTLEFTVQKDATYHFEIGYGDAGSLAPQLYSFSYDVAPRGVDITPPHVRLPHIGDRWYNRPVTGEVTAGDGPDGSGVARIELSRDGGDTWQEGAQFAVDAPADHSNDGYHFIRYRAVDVAGNRSDYRTAEVRIDTQGPVTQAWGPESKVRRGDQALVRFRVEDLSWSVRDARLVIRSAGTGRLVCVKRLRSIPSAAMVWWDPEHRFAARVTCDWPAGAYTVKVAGSTRDLAGNRWSSASCERLLVVKKARR
jgi:subtilisin family serine protease